MSSSLVPSHVRVTVHKARDLNVKGKNGFSDVYFKLKVGKERLKVKTQNGSVDHDLCEWNHSTTLPLMCLDTALQITLYSKATFEDKFLGYISIPLSGFNLFGKPVTNWHSLTVKPNKPNNKVKVKGEIEVTVCFVSSPKEITTGLSRSKENLRKSNPTLLNHDSEGSRRDLRDRIRRSFRRKKTPEQHASLDLEALNISLKEDHKYMSRPVSLAMSNGAAQRIAQNLHRSSSEKEDNFKYFKEDAVESEETQVRLQRRKFRRDSGNWGRKNSPRSCESLVQKNASLGEIRNACVASNTSIRSCSSESTSAYFSGSNPKFDHQNSNMDRESNSTNSSLEDIKTDIKQTQCQVDLSTDIIPLEPGQIHSTPKSSPVSRSRDSPSTVKRRESERQLSTKPSGVDASPNSSPTSLSKQNTHSSTPSLKHNTTGSEGYSPFNGKQPPPFIRAATHSTFTRKQQTTTTRTSSSTPTATTPGTRPRSTVSINRRTSLKELRRSPEASKDMSKIFLLAKNAAAATTASSSTGSSPVAKRKSSVEGSDPVLEKIKPRTFVSSPSKKGHTVAYTKNSPMAHNEKFSVLPPSLQKQSSISGSVSLPTLSAFTQVESDLDSRKPKASMDMIDGKEIDEAATRSVLRLEGRRPSKQLEHLFHVGDQTEALLEEKRLEEEQKLKEYRAATKEDLIKELMQQREILTQKDSELESVKTYLDNLLIRVMEVNPSLLDTVSQHKPKS